MYSPSAAALPPIEKEATGVRETDSVKRELVERSSDPLLGVTIAGKYRLDAKVGVGGMGAVYCATRLLIGDEVAVKILHSEQNDPRAADRFRREAQAAARLKHPNAVNIYDFGVTDDGLQYLVMELVEGESLRQIIKQQGPITPLTAAEILTQVCAALDEAHRNNIIHRDIKPDNIIVNSLVTGLRVKVLDFGIAKLRDDAVSSLTQTGNVLGTPHYMSPEQCLGEELDNRSDIYSLGIVLYEMLTGSVPFNSPVSTAVVIQHVNQAPPPLRTLNPSIHPAVESVVLRVLEKPRDARPQSASELAQWFDAAVRDGSAIPVFSEEAGSSALRGAAVTSMPTTTVLEVARTTGEPTKQVRRTKPVKISVAAATAAVLVIAGIAFVTVRKRGSPTAIGASSSAGPIAPAVIAFNRNFAGLVNGKFKVVMKLKRDDKDLSGTYFYEPVNGTMLHANFTKEPERWADKDINLSRIDVQIKGTIDEQKNFSIDELDAKGAPIGTFKGRFTSETEVEGKWSKPNGKNLMDFSLKDEGETSSGGNYVVQSKVFAKKAGGTKTRMSYPQIDGLSDAKIQGDFNDRIRALVNKNSGGSSDEGEGTQTGSFSIDYRSPDLLTVMFSVGIDWEGAAHPNSYNFSYNYDLQHGRALELRDFFLPGSNYLSVVAKLCAREVAIEKRNNGMTDIYEDGEAAASDALKQDATFYPTKTALVFVFDPYQVGSYAEGYYVVSIPYSQLKNIINTEGPLAPFVR